jgi:hypothetical protein
MKISSALGERCIVLIGFQIRLSSSKIDDTGILASRDDAVPIPALRAHVGKHQQ